MSLKTIKSLFSTAFSGLPDTDTAFFNIDRKDKTDAYSKIFKTKYVANSLNPRWNESFS
ncbi:Uncharacterized protein FKW44_023705, partial [Caligus rogercresseyi]